MANLRVLLDDDLFGTDIHRCTTNDLHCELTSSGSNGSAGATIIFPFPVNIVSAVSPQWEGSDFGLKGSIAQDLMKGSSATDHMKNYGKDLKDALIDYHKNSTGNPVAGAVAAMSEGSTRALHSQKLLLNAFKEVSFLGINFRTYELMFDIIAKSKKEANALVRAIREIQLNSLPGVSRAGGGMFFSYPGTWQVKFMPTEAYLPTFLPSVITNVSIDYAGNAGRVRFREDTSPISVNVTLNFMETELLTKDRVEDEYFG